MYCVRKAILLAEEKQILQRLLFDLWCGRCCTVVLECPTSNTSVTVIIAYLLGDCTVFSHLSNNQTILVRHSILNIKISVMVLETLLYQNNKRSARFCGCIRCVCFIYLYFQDCFTLFNVINYIYMITFFVHVLIRLGWIESLFPRMVDLKMTLISFIIRLGCIRVVFTSKVTSQNVVYCNKLLKRF